MDVQRYVLDQCQIQELVLKLYWGFDNGQFDVLREEVIASKIEVDYTVLFGGDPQVYSNEEFVQYWAKLKKYATVAQHSIAGVLPFLPSPTESGSAAQEAPNCVDVFANLIVYLRRDVDGGGSEEATSNGRLEVQVIKEGNKAGNPWRVSKMKAGIVTSEHYDTFWRDL